MEFEEMRKIWDSQNNKPMFAINESTLHNMVKRRIAAASWKVNFFDFGMTAITLFVGAFLTIKGINENGEWPKYLTAAAAFLIAIYVWIGRIKRKRLEERFEESLLGGLDNAISRMDYLIQRGNTFVWWYIFPFLITIGFSWVYYSKTSWWILAVLAAFIFSHWLARWEVRKWHVPKKRSLEALRKTLTQEVS